MSDGGRVDNTALEARPDVLTYTTPALDEDVEVVGEVSAEIWFRSSLPHADVFVRLCDVDERGRSTNVCDGLVSQGFSQTDTWDPLSAVKGERDQSAQRSARRMPASSPIRSSSDGQTNRCGVRKMWPLPALTV